MNDWFEINDVSKLASPALLFYEDRIRYNIQQMIKIAGSVERLRPHVKTYKCAEIIQLQLEQGITKFKCATLAEAHLLANSGAADVLIAYPLIGPAQVQLKELIQNYPDTHFAVLIDHISQLKSWIASNTKVNLFIDLDVGMHRTGVAPTEAVALLNAINQAGYHFSGWHIYDGHIHATDLQERTQLVNDAVGPALKLIEQTQTQHKEIVCGGSISFPIHAKHPERQLSPGTTLLWDYGYTSNFPDLPFFIAATVLTRIISKPRANLLCLDVGYKAVAAEMKVSPIFFPQLPQSQISVHSEEHLVIETADAEKWAIGDVLYGIPHHICPTVALHHRAAVVKDQSVITFWYITARNRNF